MIQQVNFFGVSFNYLTAKQIHDNVQAAIQGQYEQPFFIVTLNPEILLLAKDDPSYREIINSAGMKLVDGFGIELMAILQWARAGKRVPGSDLADFILQTAQENGLCVTAVVFDIGWSRPENVKKYLDGKYPKLKADVISTSHNISAESLFRLIPEDTQILLVGLGAPYQEKLIHKIISLLPSLRLAIGLGGTFDYWTGAQPRAPKLLRRMGMEWSWRLFHQPNRIKRILRALVIFPYQSLLERCCKFREKKG